MARSPGSHSFILSLSFCPTPPIAFGACVTHGDGINHLLEPIMNNRGLLILLIVVIIVGGLYYYQHTHTSSVTPPGGKSLSVTTHD
jgi:hypothetical protein